MKYPNATKGLHKILMSEIISLAASILAVIISVFALPSLVDNKPNHFTIGTVSVAMILVVVLYVTAYLLQIFGIIRASKDEPAFKISLYAIIAAMIFTILSGFFYENETVDFILMIGEDVAQFFLTHYIIHGIMHLSNHLGRPELSKKGKNIFRVIYFALIFEVIVRIFQIIYGTERGEELAKPFDIIANIMKTVEYIMFLIYIAKGCKMLKTMQKDPAESNG